MTRVRARSGHVLTVADDAAGFWVSVGYRLVEDAPAKPAPAKKVAAKKAAPKSDK